MYFDTLYLKELSNKWNVEPPDVGPVPPYMDHDWYQFITTYGEGVLGSFVLKMIVYTRFGNREVMLPDSILETDYDSKDDFLTACKNYLAAQLSYMYYMNDTKYGFYYNTLIDKVYNPIWNVDGTEERTITDTQKGYRENEKTIEGSIDETGGTVYKGSESNEHTGHDDLEMKGTKDLEKSGERSTEKTGKEITANVPMENATFYDTTRTEFDNRKDTESFTDYKESESFTDRKDVQSYFSKEKRSFDQREDEVSKSTEYNEYKENTKDKVSNDYEVKRVDSLTRQGNIGVTKSQDLVSSEMALRAQQDLLDIIVHDIVNFICYMS